MRNNCSIAHASDENSKPHHARFAAMSAITFITFVMEEIYRERAHPEIG